MYVCMHVCVCMPESWCYNQFHFLCNQEVLHNCVFSMQEKKEDAEVHMSLFYIFYGLTIILMYVMHAVFTKRSNGGDF